MTASSLACFALGHYYGLWACKQGTTSWKNGFMLYCAGYLKKSKHSSDTLSHIKPA